MTCYSILCTWYKYVYMLGIRLWVLTQGVLAKSKQVMKSGLHGSKSNDLDTKRCAPASACVLEVSQGLARRFLPSVRSNMFAEIPPDIYIYIIRVSYYTVGYAYYVCAGAAPCPRIGPASFLRLEGQRFTFGFVWVEACYQTMGSPF